MHASMQLQRGASSSCCHGHQRPRAVAAAAAPPARQQHQQQQRQQPWHEQAAASAAALSAAAALVLQACLPVQQAAAAVALPAAAAQQQHHQQQQQHLPAAAWQPVVGDVALFGSGAAPAQQAAQQQAQQQDPTLQEIEDDLMGQVALPPELTSFMELMQKGPIKSAKRLSEARRSVGFDRTLDGRVLLFSEDEEPFQVRNDMKVPGALLLRDAGGYMYYIPPSDSDSLVQIDLSDDAIVAQLFANHAWEELVEPLEVLAGDGPQAEQAGPRSKQSMGQQPAGRLEQLRLTERQFRSCISLLAGAQELPEEPLDDLDAQEAR